MGETVDRHTKGERVRVDLHNAFGITQTDTVAI
jgi:hypothetical protein